MADSGVALGLLYAVSYEAIRLYKSAKLFVDNTHFPRRLISIPTESVGDLL